jgi:hypothetical protein
MNERRLRARLRDATVPGEREAVDRTWEIVRRAYAERRPAPAASRWRLAPALAAAALLALLLLLSPAGAKIRDWIDDALRPGHKPAAPALTSLPAPGRILVESKQGPWVVNADGSARLLGSYAQASWSPNGLYVVATHGGQLVALEPDGDVRWTLTRPGRAAFPDWQRPDGYRIAYLSGHSLRAVAGDGTGDHLVAPRVARVPPKWRPGHRHILAYVDAKGTLWVRSADSGRPVFRVPRSGVRELQFSPNGNWLALDYGSALHVGRPTGGDGGAATRERLGTAISALQFSPSGTKIAFVRRSGESAGLRSQLVIGGIHRGATIRERPLFAGPGRFTDVAWSPNGRWLLVAWKDADEWLFINVRHPSLIRAVANISRQFDPGGTGRAPFPRVSGWCCPP